jgi:cytochrome c
MRRAALHIAVAILAFPPVAFAASAGDDMPGAKLFSACKSCHEVGENARHKVGPHLDGLIGRKAGSLADFRYSQAMRKAGEDGLSWNRETISAYLEKPRDFIAGNRMSYRGMADPQQRSELIDWLEVVTAAEPSENPAQRVEAEPHASASFVDIVMQVEGDPEYGEYLAGECVTCHQQSGRADGIPSIVGLPVEYFVRALIEYKINVRSNEVMKLRVSNLANDEIAALAAYFATLDPQ